MAGKFQRGQRSQRRRQRCHDKMFDGLSLSGKEYTLPNISGLWLLEEFDVYPYASDQIELESYPAAILDDSCVSEVRGNLSTPILDSVEAFSLGHFPNPFGRHYVKPDVDVPMNRQESHGLQPAENAEYHEVSDNQTVRSDANASTSDPDITSNSFQLALVNERLLVAGIRTSGQVNDVMMTPVAVMDFS